jgi:hypothetical protein
VFTSVANSNNPQTFDPSVAFDNFMGDPREGTAHPITIHDFCFFLYNHRSHPTKKLLTAAGKKSYFSTHLTSLTGLS